MSIYFQQVNFKNYIFALYIEDSLVFIDQLKIWRIICTEIYVFLDF
jgi:hypothetical protein